MQAAVGFLLGSSILHWPYRHVGIGISAPKLVRLSLSAVVVGVVVVVIVVVVAVVVVTVLVLVLVVIVVGVGDTVVVGRGCGIRGRTSLRCGRGYCF